MEDISIFIIALILFFIGLMPLFYKLGGALVKTQLDTARLFKTLADALKDGKLVEEEIVNIKMSYDDVTEDLGKIGRLAIKLFQKISVFLTRA